MKWWTLSILLLTLSVNPVVGIDWGLKDKQAMSVGLVKFSTHREGY